MNTIVNTEELKLLAPLIFPSSKQATENKARESSSEDEISPPPVVPLILDFSPEKSTVDVLQTEVKEETKIPNNSAEETQTNEVGM